MRAFVFQSDNLVKVFDRREYLSNLPFKEPDFIRGAKFGGFLKVLLVNYIEFLFFRLKYYFFPQVGSFKEHRTYCTNFRYKHILSIMWGCYDSESFCRDHDVFPTSLTNLSSFRVGHIANYSLSIDDLLIPIHKTDYFKYVFSHFFKKKPAYFPRKFFFSFSYVLPVDIIDYSNETSLFKYFPTSVPVPFSVRYPILFELLLLKFNILSFLLSTSTSHIYEFYSGGFFESILIRLRSIFDIVWFTNCSKFWKEKSVVPGWLSRMLLKFDYCNFRNFYSVKTFRFRFVYSSVYYNKLRNEVLLSKDFFPPNNFSFFLIKSFSYFFLIFFIFLLGSHIALVGLDVIIRVRLYIFFSSFVVLLILVFYYIFMRWFLRRIKFFDWILLDVRKLVRTYFRLGYLISTIFTQLLESFLSSLVGILSFFLLLIFIKGFFPDLFYCFSLGNLLFVLFLLIDNIVFSINKVFFDSTVNPLYIGKFSEAPLVGFFPFLMFALFPLFYFVVNSFLIFIFLLRVYMPEYNIFEKEPLARSSFRVPFVQLSSVGVCYDRTLISKKDPSVSKSRFDRDFIIRENFFPIYNLSYFFKFLVTRRGRMFELQYNYFDYKEFLKTSRGYKSKTYTFFPLKIIYLFMFFDLYLVWVIINFFTLLKFWCFFYFNLKLLISFSSFSKDWFLQPYFQFLTLVKNSEHLRYKDIAFSSSNLRWASFIYFDLRFERNYYKNTFRVTSALWDSLIRED